MRILIAEDDQVSRLVLRKAVEHLGHECLVATDGAEAWKLFQEGPVDIVISDWMMPGLAGPELCSKVRQHAVAGYTYFILLTTLGDKQHFLAGMQAGADDYLIKPLDREDLQARLLAAARVTSLQRELAEKNIELLRLNEALTASARTDPLTQLGNRLRLREDLQTLQARFERYGQGYCAALCDLDFFKSYNDRYGHLAGDQALRAVAETIREYCRDGDSTYRYGGEEFLIILPEQSVESARVAILRVQQAVQELGIPHSGNNPPGVVTISAGIASLEATVKKNADAVLNEADAALYQAKQAGRNRVTVYERPAA